jgi:hypothetical protein
MNGKMITVQESFAAQRKNPEHEKAYNVLKEEFAPAASMIEPRVRAGLTQQQVAKRMRTTQAVIALFESGRGSRRRAPSTPHRGDRHAVAHFDRAVSRSGLLDCCADQFDAGRHTVFGCVNRHVVVIPRTVVSADHCLPIGQCQAGHVACSGLDTPAMLLRV